MKIYLRQFVLLILFSTQVYAQRPAIRYICGYEESEILSTEKSKRPLPAAYLDKLSIRLHLEAFADGASYLLPKDILDRFGRERLGRNDGQFIMTKSEMDTLLAKTANRLELLEKELGIPQGAWKNRAIVRIDVLKPFSLNLRLASGNEAGANELWLPGGYLPTGYREAVCDPIPIGHYTETALNLN